MVIRTVSNAIRYSKTFHKGYKGLCLKLVRTFYNVPAKYPTATSAWDNAEFKHRTTKIADIPIGAPVFFSVPGLPAGHVALHLGSGKIRMNMSHKNTVETTTIAWYEKFSGGKLLGYTDDINGVRVLPKVTPKPKPKPPVVKTYMIKRGDTLGAIASEFKTTVAKIMKANPKIKDKDVIFPGDTIVIK